MQIVGECWGNKEIIIIVIIEHQRVENLYLYGSTDMSQRDFSENEPDCSPELPVANRALFLEKVRQSNEACQNGDFTTAVALYTDALALDPNNYILYSNRSAARIKQGQFALALQDATKAKELCPQWAKAYFRQGVALQCLGRYGEALAVFSSGLAQDANSKQMLSGLIEASIKSPLRSALEPTFHQLCTMKLDQSPFVVISVIGQELLQAGQYHSAVTVLESALRIGTCSLKLRGSVFSALSSAYWALNQLDKAIGYMQQDLAVAKSLGDSSGECRAHGNLGSAYFSKGSYKEALTAHRYQLVLAMKFKDSHAAASALTSLGHVYTAISDYPNALASHKQCVQLVKQMGDRLQEAREIGNVGAVYLAMGDFDSAVDCHTKHLRLARKLNNQVEEARAFSNLGSSHHYRRNFSQAIVFHEQVLRIAQQLGDKSIETRAYAGLGHAARCSNNFAQAKRWHEKQLEMALAARDKIGEGRACSNLGIVYQLLGDYDGALKLHQAHLTISRQQGDRAGIGRAFGNIGNAYSAAGLYEEAIKYHKQELTISKEVRDRSAEASTHGNLAVTYQSLGAYDMALMHYRAHLNIARELKDTAGEACALLNLGNCLSSRQEFSQAVPYYEQYLMLSQELGDIVAEGKACHFLGYAHYCIGNYREAVRYYDQDLALAKDLQDKMNMGRAYCNLGLAHLGLNNTSAALECQKYFLAIAHMTNHLPGKFRALGNIGDVLIRTGEIEESAKMYQRQLALARQYRDRAMEATSYGALGLAHRLMKRFDKALGYHTQELTLRQEICDLLGECRAHGHLGAVHMALGNYTHAIKCYQEQLDRAQDLQDRAIEAQAYGNLGIAKLNSGHYEDAIGYLEQQLGTLEQVNLPTAQHDRARALGLLGDCYDALSDFEEGIKCHERHLQLAIALQSPRDQERAYCGLGHSHKALGNLQEALVCLEKRLVVAHELGNLEAKAAAYGDLGNIHSALGNNEQAVNCLEHQRNIAQDMGDRYAISDSTSSLGQVFLQMKNYDGALKLHLLDKELCESLGVASLQARTYGNLGAVYESLGNYSEAVRHFERQLQLASDRLIKAFACESLGRVFHVIGETSQAINYLRQGLVISQSLNKSEEEAKIRHRLGLVLIDSGDSENARSQLETAAQILESVRLEQRSPEAKQHLYDLQTKCYHLLQKILVSMGKNEEALVAAERCKSRASLDTSNSRKTLVTCSETIFDIVNKSKTNIIYFSLADDELYTWFLQPQKRIVRFNAIKVNEVSFPLHGQKEDFIKALSKSQLLESHISMLRDDLGVNSENTIQEASDWHSSENLLDDFASERSGFLRMINRNHLLNSSNYSLSSLFSLGSVGGSVASLQGSTRSIGSLQGSTRSRRGFSLPQWQGPNSLHALYNLLLAPFEDLLPSSASTPRTGHKELILVLENELYLIPFAVLKSGQDGSEYLSERCSLLTTPSLQMLRQKSRIKARPQPATNETTSALVVGPRIPVSLTESQGWIESTASLQEAAMVSDMLQAKTLVATNATKNNVLNELATAECVHFAAAINWKTSGVVLSPGDMMETPSHKRFFPNDREVNETETEDGGNDVNSNGVDIPPLNDFLLGPEDINSVKLNAKLIVLSAYNSLESISGIGVANLSSLWLRGGACAILLSLWPVQETAAKILLRAFYSALLQGAPAARALAEAMQTVQHTKHFAHPSNWAGFLLIGGNVRLSNKVALIGQALRELVRTPEKCRDALRVCLHLVEKSLQRIHRGQKNAMYTTQKSIDNKAGTVNGWKDLLMAVGFRFEPAANGIPSSVFFPQTNPDERLSQCSASLQALLALSPTTLHALSKLVNNAEIADDIIAVMRNVVSQYPPKGSPDNETNIQIEIPLSVRLWRVSGCHELLASLGYDLMEVGQDQVTLRTGKQANRRNCQFVLQALLALFDTHEAPKSLGIDSSSSCESLNDEKRPETHSNTLNSNPAITANSQQRSVSPVGTVKSLNLKMPRPTLPAHRPLLSSGSAFTSYVRKRGEPDGGRTDVEANPMSTLTSIELNTDSDISDGYSTQTVNRFELKSKMNYSSFRTPIKVGRPGGGGESDAAFTPSPPITLQNVENNVSIALAHQTRIRNLYSAANAMNNLQPNETHIQNSQRPDDSSSSASSTNDWDGSGHATVLRRAQQNLPNGLPPMPPPRQTMPIVDTLRPQVPLPTSFNNLNSKNAIETTSSDSEFEKMYEPRANAQKSAQQQFLSRKIPEECLLMDRLSVRTENTNIVAPSTHFRKQMKVADDATQLPFKFSANSLYFPSSDNDVIEPQHKDISLTLKANSAKENNKPNLSSHNKNIQDLILRKINREMTPTISDVYHERNIDLGLAPPLSKLLLSKNYEENDTKTNTIKKANSSETVSDITLNTSLAMYVNEASSSDRCDNCKHSSDILCQCKATTKKLTSNAWLNNLNGNSSAPSNDLSGTADTTDRKDIQNSFNGNDNESSNLIEDDNNSSNISSNTLKRGNSPYSDFSKRDEGDGRSVAESQCSGNYKSIDLNANSKLSQVQQRINKFNMNSSK